MATSTHDDVVLGVDSSTQSTTVVAIAIGDGSVLAVGRAPHPPATPPRSEQDPRAWWEALVTACSSIPTEIRSRVRALAVGGQQHGLVVCADDGAPLRPAKLWNDTESAAAAKRLVEARGPDRWASDVGSVPVASFTITKLAWLAEQEPRVVGEIARVLLPHDWLTHRLTGNFVTDRGDASGTGYWSADDGWRPDLVALALGDPAVTDRAGGWLPTVLEPTAPAGEITGAAATALGLPRHVVVGPGSGDNMAAALGLGMGPGDVAISLGTSGVVHAVTERQATDPTGVVAGFADASGRFLPLVCTLNATKVTDTIARLLGAERDRFASLALEAPAGAEGVVLVPHFDGERTPNRPDAAGSIGGLRNDTTPPLLARAAHEGVVCGLLYGLDALRAATSHAPDAPGRVRDESPVPDDDGRLLLIGGGAHSPAYRQIVADLAGAPVTIPDADEAVATGAAVQAAAVLTGNGPTALALIARRWSLGTGEVVNPDTEVDPLAVRRRYSDAAGLPYPE